MKLTFIELKDFRQFRGRHVLNLSTDPKKNVTLIYAENGVGKTTILNAVLWAMHEQTTAKFTNKQDLLNWGAKSDGETTAWVRVRFQFQNEEYQVTRTVKEGSRRTNLTVGKLDAGVEKAVPQPEAFLGSVVPESMAPYFFFDGENAEAFGNRINKKKVTNAVRGMLGFDQATDAQNDLKYVEDQFRKALKTLPGAGLIQKLDEEITALEVDLDRQKKGLEDEETKLETDEHRLEQVKESLRRNVNARELQEKRDRLERGRNQAKSDLKKVTEERVAWVSKSLPSLISTRLAKETLDFVDEESVKGRIPAPYNEHFVQGILQDKTCICGRPVEPGTEHYGHVQALLSGAANVALLSRVVQARSRILSIKMSQSSAVSTLDKLDARAANLNERLREVEQKLHAATQAVAGIDLADVQQNERARDTLARQVRESNQTIGRLKQSIKSKQAEVERKKRELNLKSQENDKSRLVAHHMNIAAQARAALTDAATAYEAEARNAISHKVEQILEKVLRKDYTFHIDDDFSIKLMSGENIVPPSSGEAQVLGLLFTAALCDYSRDRLEDKTAFLTPGTVAPMVLDSPLGKLDETYKFSTAEFLPTMADQVILLLSSSQGDAATINTLRPHVGKEYLLQAHNTENQDSRGDESKNIGGKDYPLTVYNAEQATTKVVEIPV